MAGPKIQRRDLKEDKVYVTLAEVAGFFSRQRLPVALGILAMVVAFAIGYLATIQREHKQSEGSLALYEVNKIEDPAARAEALEKLAKDFSGSATAEKARYQRANLLSDEGKYEEARRAFAEFLKRYPNQAFAPAALEALGYCDESLGQWKEAAEDYTKLKEEFPSSPEAKRIIYRQGVCYEKLGETEKAASAYRKTEETLSDSLWADYAKDRLAAMGLKPTEEPAAAESAES